jgi:hypothetical protein
MPPVKSFGTIGVILAAVALVSPTTAEAQTKEQKAGARAAAEAGGDAFDAGKYAEAADLFERAERLIHAPPHLLYGARANVKLGRLVEARELYLGLTREKLASSAPRAFRDAQQMGEKELADVEARLPYISVVVQGGPVQMPVKVTRNGEPVPPELVGIPTPANPGEYSYQAFAEGMESTATSIKLKEGARETVVLTLHEIPGYAKPTATDGPASAPPKNSASGSLSSPELSDTGNARGRPYLYASIASFGLAVVGGVVGPIFLVKSSRTKEDADALFASCNPTRSCSGTQVAEIESIDSRATMQQGIGIGGLVTAGLGIAGGITFLVMDQSRSVAEGPRVTPFVGLNRVGVVGTF